MAVCLDQLELGVGHWHEGIHYYLEQSKNNKKLRLLSVALMIARQFYRLWRSDLKCHRLGCVRGLPS
jgi:hypothetical protein